jgi:lipoprotein-anchoring transpeptidase ErfK/SrfK
VQSHTHAVWAVAPPTLRRLALLTGVAVLGVLSAGAASAAPTVRPTQELVALLASHEVHTWPNAKSSSLPLVSSTRPITGVRTVLPVLGQTKNWLHVRLPGRPNGRTGWIRKQATATSVTPWHLVVEVARRRVLAFRRGHVVKIFTAVVGKPSTPTPIGTYFVEEAVRLLPGGVGAPFALALSARSDVFQEFAGGPGQIALHGLDGIGGVPGTAVSHGCIRLDGAAMTWLVLRIRAGTPVTITN